MHSQITFISFDTPIIFDKYMFVIKLRIAMAATIQITTAIILLRTYAPIEHNPDHQTSTDFVE